MRRIPSLALGGMSPAEVFHGGVEVEIIEMMIRQEPGTTQPTPTDDTQRTSQCHAMEPRAQVAILTPRKINDTYRHTQALEAQSHEAHDNTEEGTSEEEDTQEVQWHQPLGLSLIHI